MVHDAFAVAGLVVVLPLVRVLLRARIGYKKALMAIARKLLLIIRKILVAGEDYKEPAPEPVSLKAKQRAVQKRVKDLQMLGYEVSLIPFEAMP